jgi:hypothetical protein
MSAVLLSMMLAEQYFSWLMAMADEVFSLALAGKIKSEASQRRSLLKMRAGS